MSDLRLVPGIGEKKENDAKQHYHCYSLDASPGIEHHFPEQVISPEDILTEKETEREQEAAHARIYDRILERCAPILFAGKNFGRKTPGPPGRRRKTL